MTGAFALVAFQTFWNRLVARVRKLRQPRYLAGGIAAALYFWFVIFRNAHRHGFSSSGGHVLPLQIELMSLVVLTIMILAWALPADTGGLDFTEAEVAFLFPAPLSRRQLLLYKVIRSQPSTLMTALVMSVFALHGNFAGLWFAFSTLGIYFMLVSLGRARLRLAGINVIWRIAGVILMLAALSYAATLSFPSMPADFLSLNGAQPSSALHAGWVGALLLVPRLFVTAVFPPDVRSFALSAAALFALAAVFFLGAIRLNVSFEEASVAVSRRKAARRNRLIGRRSGTHVMFQRIGPPFRLAESGPAETAIVWKNVIALLRISLAWVVILTVVLVVAVIAGIAWPVPQTRVSFAFLLAALAGVFPLIGPNIFTNDLRLDLSRIEVLKSYPIAGDRLVAAEIAAPLAVISLFEIAFLGAASMLVNLVGAPVRMQLLANPQFIVVALLFAVPVCALQLLIRNAVPVVFPGWATRPREDPRGFLMVGQRLVIMAGNLFVLFGALLPAAVVFAPSLWLAMHFFSGSPGLMAVATLPAIALIVVEVWMGTQMLGSQFERLDISADLDTIAV
ncbi:MAG TPA: putative ABC exporter domain-containing protein [Thermoanaerobaculia bacterium]